MKTKSFMAIGCTHRPFHDTSYCDWVLEQVEEKQPEVFVHCGDLFDQQAVSSYAKGNLTQLAIEYESANEFMELINDTLPSKATKVFLQGNHCSRIFRPQYQHLSDVLDFRKHCQSLNDWRVYPYRLHPDSVYRLGQVTFCHGFKTSQRSHIEEAIKLGNAYGLYIRAHTHSGYSPRQIHWSKLALPYWTANTGCGIDDNVEYFQTWDNSLWNRGLITGWTMERTSAQKPRWNAEFIEHSRFWG